MVELGNFQAGIYTTQYPDATESQKDPLLKWNSVVKISHLQYVIAGTHIILEEVGTFNSSYAEFTNLTWIQNRFNLATTYKDQYEYAAYLMYEELFHPVVRAQWNFNPISTWQIEGSLLIAGQTIELIKTWALRVKGTWDQTKWDSIAANNSYNDPLVWEWSVDYSFKLHTAWVTHIRSIGKKTAIIGLVGTDGWNSINFIYPEPLRSYIIQNFDMIYTYTIPNSLSTVQKGIDVVTNLRNAGFSGLINHVLTARWSSTLGTADETVQFAEYKGVSPYVDIISVFPYYDMSLYPGTGNYPERLIKFYETTCPPPQCDFTITQ